MDCLKNNMDIDITITSSLRPELLDKTLNSFKTNLFNDDKKYRIIINIDPAGDIKKKLELTEKSENDIRKLRL